MKHKKNLWSDVSILVVAVLAITALVRGTWQYRMLAAVFIAWSAWAGYRHLIPYLKEIKHSREAKKVKRHYEKQMEERPLSRDVDISEPMSIVLLRHVNHRISAYLQSTYPEATWDWCEENPEYLVSNGGIGRIRLSGVPDFNYAEVTLDQSAKIDCQFLKIVPFAVLQNGADEQTEEKPKPKTPSEIDPQIWFEKQGRTVLQNLVADLASRGHSSLTIEANGSILIKQDGQDIKRPAFSNLPGKEYWPRLCKVFERNGIASEITDNGLLLSW